jgi:hypothetical protein
MLRDARWNALVIAVALLTASASLGHAAEEHYLKLKHAASVEGILLKPGAYTVQVESQESQAVVRFVRESRIVATAHGRIEEAAGIKPQDTLFYTKDTDGTNIITKLRLKNTTHVVVFPVIRTKPRPAVNPYQVDDTFIDSRAPGHHRRGPRIQP